MSLRADPPDFIQSGSYNLTSFSGLKSALMWVVATTLGLFMLGVAYFLARDRSEQAASRVEAAVTGGGGGDWGRW